MSSGMAPLTITLTLNVLNGNPPFTTVWTTPGGTPIGVSDTWNKITRNYLTVGVYTASATVTDAVGNTAFAQITISAQGAGAVVSGMIVFDALSPTERGGLSQIGVSNSESFARSESITITQ